MLSRSERNRRFWRSLNKVWILLAMLNCGLYCHAQEEYYADEPLLHERSSRWPAAILPGKSAKVHGAVLDFSIAGLSNSRRIAPQSVNGLLLGLNPGQLGVVAFGLPYMVLAPLELFRSAPEEVPLAADAEQGKAETQVNGAALYPFGLASMEEVTVTGVLLSTFAATAHEIKGLGLGGLIIGSAQSKGLLIGGLMSSSLQHRGVQIGLFNDAGTLSGLQIGLLNRVGTRVMPVINVGFGNARTKN